MTLSNNASAVLGSVFGFNSVVTYHMQEYVPSPEMQEALDELVKAGILVEERGKDDMPQHGEAVRYRVAEGFDLVPFRRAMFDMISTGSDPKIRLMVKKGEANGG